MAWVDILIAADKKKNYEDLFYMQLLLLMTLQLIAKYLSWEKYICPSPPEGVGNIIARLGHTMEMANIGGGKQEKVQSSHVGMHQEQQSHSKQHTLLRANFKGYLVELNDIRFFWSH